MNRLILQFTAQLHLRKYSDNSIQNHRLDLVRFKGWLEARELAEVAGIRTLKPEDIRAYQAELGKTLKQRTINRHLSSLKLFFGFLEEGGLIETNPMDKVSFQKIVHSLPNMLLPGEVSALLESPPETHYQGLRDKAILELLYSSGLKLHEVIGLDLDSLKLDLGFVQVKGKRERMVPLTEKTVALLRRYLKDWRPTRTIHPEDRCLFPGRGGKRITRVGVWKLIKKYAKLAGIEKNFNPRALRHAFAMHMILRGMDLDGIKFLFGYKQLEATALYAHVNAPDFREAYQAFHPTAAGE